ncbi:MAG: hypothetical protein H6728_07455 [Myxococcales bacterium]|nr:hypothetical protein [Myxococcales bacterium]
MKWTKCFSLLVVFGLMELLPICQVSCDERGKFASSEPRLVKRELTAGQIRFLSR